jgi:hypothetical protein
MNYKSAQISSLGRAKKFADALLDEIKFDQGDNASLLLLSSHPEVIVEATKNKDLLKAEIAEIKPSDLGTSILRTAELIKQEIDKKKNLSWRIYIITDLTRVGWETEEKEAKKLAKLLKEISSKEAKDREVFLVDVGPKRGVENLAITSLKLLSKLITSKRPIELQAEIHNFSNETKSDYSVSLFVRGEKKEIRKITIPGNSSLPVIFRYEFYEDGPQKIWIELQKDNLSTDDRRYLALDVKESAEILAINGEPRIAGRDYDETHFYKIALSPMDFPSPFKVIERTEYELSGFLDRIHKSDLVVLANVKTLTQEVIEELENYVKKGGGLFIVLGANISKADYNEFLYKNGQGLLPAKLLGIGGDIKKERATYLSEIKYDHKIFRFFSQEEFRAYLLDTPFWQFYRTKPQESEDVKVLARYNDPAGFSPAFIEKRFGKGNVLLFTSTIDLDWNLMIAFPTFLTLMHEIAYYLISKPPIRKNVGIFDQIELMLDFKEFAEGYTITLPDKTTKTLQHKLVTTPTGQKIHLLPELAKNAGIYTIQKLGADPEEKPISYFAANIDTKESNLEKITEDELKQRFKDFHFQIRSMEREKGKIDIEPPRRGIWKFLLCALIAFVALESILAWLFGRGKA